MANNTRGINKIISIWKLFGYHKKSQAKESIRLAEVAKQQRLQDRLHHDRHPTALNSRHFQVLQKRH